MKAKFLRFLAAFICKVFSRENVDYLLDCLLDILFEYFPEDFEESEDGKTYEV